MKQPEPKGKPVTTLVALETLARQHRSVSVVLGGARRNLAAAFVINIAGSQILRMIDTGMYANPKKGGAK